MSARAFSILDAISDQRLFGQAFRDLKTWRAWLVFLAGLFALPMSEAEVEVWRECTGRSTLPQKPFTEAWLVCGRRSGKSFVADIKRAMRAQMAKLAADAQPTLSLTRGRAEAVFRDVKADFGITPAWVAGLLCWFDQERMLKLIDAMVDAAIPDDGSSMTMDEQRQELAKLDAEIDAWRDRRKA